MKKRDQLADGHKLEQKMKKMKAETVNPTTDLGSSRKDTASAPNDNLQPRKEGDYRNASISSDENAAN